MFYADLTEIPQDIFGGYCTAIPPSNPPSGAASIAQDCEFPQGAVRTRGGLTSFVSRGNSPVATLTLTGVSSGGIFTGTFVFPAAVSLSAGQQLTYAGGSNAALF